MLIFIFEKISNEEKSIHIIELLAKKADWESLSKNILSSGNHKSNEKCLVSSGSMSGVDMIHLQEEYENALKGVKFLNKKS